MLMTIMSRLLSLPFLLLLRLGCGPGLSAEAFFTSYYSSSSACIGYQLGNGVCDFLNNNAQCQYDLGDCCCGYAHPLECVDPGAPLECKVITTSSSGSPPDSDDHSEAVGDDYNSIGDGEDQTPSPVVGEPDDYTSTPILITDSEDDTPSPVMNDSKDHTPSPILISDSEDSTPSPVVNDPKDRTSSPILIADSEEDTPSPVVNDSNDGTSSPVVVIVGGDNDSDQDDDEEDGAPEASADDDSDAGDANRSGSEGFTDPASETSAAVRVTTTAQFGVVMAVAVAAAAMAVRGR